MQLKLGHGQSQIKPDFRNDFIIGKLNYDGTWQNFCTLNPDLQATLDMNVDTNVAFVRYTGDSTPTQLVESDNTPIYDNITITATASGYSSPQFTIAGAGFSQVDSSPVGRSNSCQRSFCRPRHYRRKYKSFSS